MTIKFIVLIFIAGCVLADCKKSFVIVLDTTASMRDEIITLKNHIDSIVKTLPSTGGFDNYILVPYTDPDVLSPKISLTPEGLLNSLNDLEVRGGSDCPENSLAAIVKALETSNNYSNIFLFTDAPAKDINKLPLIRNLCRERQSQVVTFVSGECPGEPRNNINVYNEIAKVCSGTAFHFDIQNLRQALNYMKAIVNVEWSHINTHKEFAGRKLFNFNVDKYTKDIIVAVAGDYPEIQVTNSNGENAVVDKIMDTKHALVIRLLQAPIGEYNVEVCSRGLSMTTFYKWKTLEFKYGFSPKKPKSLNETSNAPLPDATSYLIIEQLEDTIELILLELKTDNEKKVLGLEVLDVNKRFYMIQGFFKADKPFQISILGKEKNTYELIKGTSKVIMPQAKVTSRPIRATIETIQLESPLVEYMKSVTLFCKVTGEPKPDIWWVDDKENRLPSEDALFEWPSTYISYATIDNATSNATVYCKSENAEGDSSMSEELFVHREFTFEVLESPSDKTIAYGTEGKLFCKATAYPEPTIKWYHNDTSIENTDNVEIVLEDNMLLIKSMTLEDIGEYKCEVTNEVETKTFTALVDISGVEAPSIEIPNSEYILQLGESLEIDCKVLTGEPSPKVTWKKQVDDEFVDFPEGVSVQYNTLTISSAQVEHNGVYKCEVSNVLGEDSKEVTVKIQYAPKIKNGDNITMVNGGESVQLECEVDAEPKAVVHWDMYQDDVIVTLDSRHSTDEQYTHRFVAQPRDSGFYYCVAENELGRSERKVNVVILEAPFIEPLGFNSLKAHVGTNLRITCNVSLGRPVPVTRWELISPKSSVSVISRKTTSALDLVLRNISKANEGAYQCVAENVVAPDSIRFYLTVVP